METNKKYAIVTGATQNGIGASFARRLIARGYIVYAQYRNDAGLAKLQEIFSFTENVRYFFSDLINTEELKKFFTEQKEEGVLFEVVVLAAGGWKSDTDKRFTSVDEVIKDLDATNYLTKKYPLNAFFEVYQSFSDVVHLFLISSHVSKLTLEEAKAMEQIAYVSSMKHVNELGREINHPNVVVKVLQTERIETHTLKNVRIENPDVPLGEDGDEYAEKVLKEAFAPKASI